MEDAVCAGNPAGGGETLFTFVVLRKVLCTALMFALDMSDVAPAGMSNSVFYVNPEGGRYLHTMAQCETIAPEFWEAMRRYEGEQGKALLNEVDVLTPCPVCYSRSSR